MYKLLESSWRDDAVVLDRKKGVYTVPDRVREINHEGKYFSVPGPHICQPSPQRTPLILQAGASKAGKSFAAQNAEAIFVSAHAPEVCAKNVAEIRQIASSQFGRDGKNIKFLALVTPIIGRTEEEAQASLQIIENMRLWTVRWRCFVVGLGLTLGSMETTRNCDTWRAMLCGLLLRAMLAFPLEPRNGRNTQLRNT